jgi:uncharacterized delta-60 repeat protein
MCRRRFTPRLETLEGRALLNAGALDPTFAVAGTGISNTTYGLVTTSLPVSFTTEFVSLQPNDKIVVVGSASDANSNYSIVRYNSDGTLDLTFGSNGFILGQMGESIHGLASAANGAIIAPGTANQDALISEFNSNGTPNTSFGANGFVSLDSEPGSQSGNPMAASSWLAPWFPALLSARLPSPSWCAITQTARLIRRLARTA